MNALVIALKIVATLFTVMAVLPIGYYVFQFGYGEDPTRPKNLAHDLSATLFFMVPLTFIVLVAVWF